MCDSRTSAASSTTTANKTARSPTRVSCKLALLNTDFSAEGFQESAIIGRAGGCHSDNICSATKGCQSFSFQLGVLLDQLFVLSLGVLQVLVGPLLVFSFPTVALMKISRRQ